MIVISETKKEKFCNLYLLVIRGVRFLGDFLSSGMLNNKKLPDCHYSASPENWYFIKAFRTSHFVNFCVKELSTVVCISDKRGHVYR